MKDPVTWLYPPIEPYNVSRLRVSPVHEIYFEESGNPSGKAVVFLHGGPGGGSEPKQRRFFHPEKYRIVNFDQRGCGKSTPYASLEANTTWDLVADIETIREHLGIERWQVFGASWGSTLALAYSEAHPDRVTELILRGIFLLRKQEIDWFYQRGASVLYPDAWEPYLSHIPEGERSDLLRLMLHTAPLHGVSHHITGPKTAPYRADATIARLANVVCESRRRARRNLDGCESRLRQGAYYELSDFRTRDLVKSLACFALVRK